MVSEEVKFKFNVSAVAQSGQSVYSVANGKSNSDIQIFEEFKKYANSKGLDVTPEKLQQLLAEHPEILNLTEDQQPAKILELLTSEQQKTLFQQKFDELKKYMETDVQERDTSKVRQLAEEVAKELQNLPAEEQEIAANEFSKLFNEEEKSVPEDTKAAQTSASQVEAKQSKQVEQKTETEPETKAEEKKSNPFVKDDNNVESVDTQPEQVATPQTEVKQSKQVAAKAEAETKVEDKKSNAFEEDEKNSTVNGDKNKSESSILNQSTAEKYKNAYNIADSFDSVAYENLSVDEKIKVYAIEVAKNKVTCVSSTWDSKKWDKLSDNEKDELIAEAEKQIKKEFEEERKLLAADKKNIKFPNSEIMNVLMIQVQTANLKGMQLFDFRNQSPFKQYAQTADMLYLKAQAPNANKIMSKYENEKYEKVMFLCDAMSDYAKQHNMPCTEICPEDIIDIAEHKDERYQIPVGVALRDYLAKIPENERTQEQQAQYEFLNKMPAGYLESYGTRMGGQSALEDKILAEHPEYYAKLKNATGIQKARLKAEYFKKVCGDNPQQFEAFIKSAIETGDALEVIELMKLASKFPSLQEQLALTKDNDTQLVVSGQAEVLGDKGVTYLENLDDSKRSEEIKDSFRESASGKQLYSKDMIKFYSACADSAKWVKQAIEKNKDCTVEEAEQYANTIAEINDDEMSTAMTKASKLASEETQLIYFENGIKNDAALKEAPEILPELASKNQTGAAIKVKENAEERLPKEEAVTVLKDLSDQVAKCNKDNQLSIHKIISSSKYEEVAVYAASNIYKYDKSVQAGAVQATYATGNVKAVKAAMSNYTKMSPDAQIEIAAAVVKNPQYVAIVKEAMGQNFVKDELTIKLIQNESEARIPKSEKELLLEKWNSLSSTEKYNFMVSLSVKYLIKMSPALRRRVLEYAQKDPDLMKRLVETYGINLLGLSEAPAVLGMIVHELWNNPDNRYQIARMVCQDPDKYPTSVVEDCELLLAENNGIDEKEFNKLSSKDKKLAATDFTFASNPYEFGTSAQSGGSRNNRVLSSFNKINPNYIA